MSINIIVAIDKNRGIGKDNQLPWHMPADLKFFKEKTTGHTVIMGRKTFESMGRGLPNRRNIVVSRQSDLRYEKAEVVDSLPSALSLCNENAAEVFIIGGAELFKDAFKYADRLYITEIHHTFDADTFLPPFNKEAWQEIHREDKEADEKNPYPFSFTTYKKK